MAQAILHEFPLFPLAVVALPSEYVPLHVFEPRYRTMIAQCLERQHEFGIVWMADDELKQVGCACRIERVLEKLDDGRLNILARGTRPFRLIAREDHLPYPAGTVEFLDDRGEDSDAVASETARAAYAALVKQATDEPPDPEEVSEMGAYEMAATIDFGPDAKQGLLQLRSENARLRLVTRLFRAAAKRLEVAEAVQTRAASNGKVHLG